jgi:CRP-like cAMP-binding protein
MSISALPTFLQNQRPANREELAAIPWLAVLPAEWRTKAEANIRVTTAQPGDYICRVGKPVSHWFGVIEGLIKMSSDSADGKTTTFIGVPSGGWFGEGTVLKREPYRYNIQPLRETLVAGITTEMFMELLDHSIAFNRFVMQQLNERVSQFISGPRGTHLGQLNESAVVSETWELGENHTTRISRFGGLVAPAGQCGAAAFGVAKQNCAGIRRP